MKAARAGINLSVKAWNHACLERKISRQCLRLIFLKEHPNHRGGFDT